MVCLAHGRGQGALDHVIATGDESGNDHPLAYQVDPNQGRIMSTRTPRY